MTKFYVTGGVFTDSTFEILEDEKDGRITTGPFETLDEAKREWRALSMQFVDTCYARFSIVDTIPEPGEQTKVEFSTMPLANHP